MCWYLYFLVVFELISLFPHIDVSVDSFEEFYGQVDNRFYVSVVSWVVCSSAEGLFEIWQSQVREGIL